MNIQDYLCSSAGLTKDISPKTHRGLISKFGEEFMKMEDEAKNYAAILHKAEDLREMADYGVFKEMSKRYG